MKKLITIIGLALLGVSGVKGQVILDWNFTDDNATFDSGTPVNFTISPITIGNSLGTVSDPVNTSSASSGYAGASGTGNIGNAFRVGALDTGASGSGFFEFTIDPSAGFTFSITNFDFGSRSTSTGPQAFTLRSSQDSYAADLFTVTVPNTAGWALRDNAISFTSSTPDTAVTFRLFGHNGTGSASSGTINGRVDDITMTVTATAVPEPGMIAFLTIGLGVVAVLRRRRA